MLNNRQMLDFTGEAARTIAATTDALHVVVIVMAENGDAFIGSAVDSRTDDDSIEQEIKHILLAASSTLKGTGLN